MPERHARLSPSASKRWLSCPGSLVLTAGAPREPSVYSDAGTAMHTMAADCLTKGIVPDEFAGENITVSVGDELLRQVFVTEDMVETVRGYVDSIRELAHGLPIQVEQEVDFSAFVNVPDQFGTADAVIYDPEAGELMVIDLKTGRRPVSPEENSQLMLYALGALAKLVSTPATPAADQEIEDELW